MFAYIAKLIAALNSNKHPGEIAHAASLGLLLAFVPRSNALWVFLFALTLFLRINKGAFFLTLILFSFLVPLVDTYTEAIGYTVLTYPSLQPALTTLYETPFMLLTRFNNTVVAGGLVLGLACYIPFYIISRLLVALYRSTIMPKLANNKVVMTLTKLPIVKKLRFAADTATTVKEALNG
jgi:uncharacterized protein (TIGR03546 family)